MLVCGDLNFPEIDWDAGYPNNPNGLAYSTAEVILDYGLTQLDTHPSRDKNDDILVP